MKIGSNVQIWSGARIEALAHTDGEATITIGNGTIIQPSCHIAAVRSIIIGDNCLFASSVYVTDHDHYWLDLDLPYSKNNKLLCNPVIIGDNVWLGEGVCVLKGVRIGNNAIVGTGSVVTRDIPPDTISVGSPARPIKRWSQEEKKWRAAD
ncbi:MAG: DapH/DapD/GlmU-related protein [Pseudomonadales bacterium]